MLFPLYVHNTDPNPPNIDHWIMHVEGTIEQCRGTVHVDCGTTNDEQMGIHLKFITTLC